MTNFSPRQYEDYVEKVLKKMEFWRDATILRNHCFPGVRQKGDYEVDIALRLKLTELVSFLLIVECKNHARPVTRPVIQQLAQTRDAITAQKAAVVSPVGFSKEAIDVAKDLGIALWVIGSDIPTAIVMASEGLKILSLSDLFYKLRISYLQIFGVIDSDLQSDNVNLVDFEAVEDPGVIPEKFKEALGDSRFWRPTQSGSAFFSYANHPVFDEECAVNQIIITILKDYRSAFSRDESIRANLDHWEAIVAKFIRTNELNPEAIPYVKEGNWQKFYDCFP